MMKTPFQLAVAAALLSPFGVSAWGELGHETIGYVIMPALPFISATTLSSVQSSLGSTYNFSLGPAAPWADTVRAEAAYAFTAPYHFVDAEDSPPSSCSVSISRDCGASGCIISAIQNYTKRVQETSLSKTQRQEALKFITHFIGDIGQPLHVEAYEVGGNDIKATCSGKSTNLHATWDTGMITKNLDANYNSDPQVWAAAIAKEIKSGTYASVAASWVSCISASELSSTSCPLVWAEEANSFDCTDVFNFTTGQDLCDSDYYDAAIPIIDEQVAKQGYRLAKWLDAIYD
ncbi:nuclease Le1 [Artomyces pyxidatus]|uniref:Nuclease Le1 n=1 Tax=Artomyces pyxidatus TaxID=48021 RepID=A0ACB8TCD5_9AGAM|nr:nuclease Le1 [Artomyces pyxidatus]